MGRQLTDICKTLEEAKEKWPEISFDRCKNKKGDKFNHLTIIYRTNSNDRKQSYVICQCDCEEHSYIKVRLDHLKNGSIKSCGCLNMHNIKNQKFGKLTALYPTDKRSIKKIIWHCRCDCGNECDVRIDNLIYNITLSCGMCYGKSIRSKGEEKISQILRENNIYFEEQKTFENCINLETNRKLIFDFYVDNKYLIEFDGIQHFKVVGWNTKEQLKNIQKRDNIKNKWCKDNNIELIRIPYTYYENLCIEDLILETSKFIYKKE